MMMEIMTLAMLPTMLPIPSNDILEIKAVMGVFATNRKIEGKTLPVHKHQTAWGKMKYAAILVISIILDAIIDFDDPLEEKISK